MDNHSLFISFTTETSGEPNDQNEGIQEETDVTDLLKKNDRQAEEVPCAPNSCCDWSFTIVSCIALLSLFIYMWADLPTMTSSYKQANEHLNGTVSHSPNYVGFGKRQNLVCNSSISIGTVLQTKKTFLPFLDFD